MYDPAKWNDVTSYSKGERGSSPPSAYELRVGPLKLCVHRYHGEDPTQWFGTCHELGIERQKIDKPGASAEAAQQTFYKNMAGYVKRLHKLFDKV